MRLLLIDNFDSFTYNLVQYFGELGAEQEVFRNNSITSEQAIEREPDAVVISPGPCDPDQAGHSLAIIEAFAGKSQSSAFALGINASANISAEKSFGPSA